MLLPPLPSLKNCLQRPTLWTLHQQNCLLSGDSGVVLLQTIAAAAASVLLLPVTPKDVRKRRMTRPRIAGGAGPRYHPLQDQHCRHQHDRRVNWATVRWDCCSSWGSSVGPEKLPLLKLKHYLPQQMTGGSSGDSGGGYCHLLVQAEGVGMSSKTIDDAAAAVVVCHQ